MGDLCAGGWWYNSSVAKDTPVSPFCFHRLATQKRGNTGFQQKPTPESPRPLSPAGRGEKNATHLNARSPWSGRFLFCTACRAVVRSADDPAAANARHPQTL